jgi:hypothetical protein
MKQRLYNYMQDDDAYIGVLTYLEILMWAFIADKSITCEKLKVILSLIFRHMFFMPK